MLITHHTLIHYAYKQDIYLCMCEGVCVCVVYCYIFPFYFSKTCNLNFVDKMSFAAWAWATSKWEMSGSFLEFHLEWRRSCFNMINERIQKTCFHQKALSSAFLPLSRSQIHTLSCSLSKQLSIVEILYIIISKANLNTLRSSWLWRPLALSQLNFTFFTYLYAHIPFIRHVPLFLFPHCRGFQWDSLVVCVCVFHFKVCD